jgi:hypothetical protein
VVVEVKVMRCWACNQSIAVTDMANRLPLGGAIVHRECYAEATGQQPPLRLTLADTLRFEEDAA